jgi:hypothetical protein
MKRKEMITRLVNDDIETIKNAMRHNDNEYLFYVLTEGIGYHKLTNEQLIEECNNRTWELSA